MSNLHRDATSTQVHEIHFAEYPDAATRAADVSLDDSHVYKTALQLDNMSYWTLLSGGDPPLWEWVGGGFGTAAKKNLAADPASPEVGDIAQYIPDGNGGFTLPGLATGSAFYRFIPGTRFKPDGTTDATMELPPGRYRIRGIGGGGFASQNAAVASGLSGATIDALITLTSAQTVSFAGTAPHYEGAVSIGSMITIPSGPYCTYNYVAPLYDYAGTTVGTLPTWANDGTNTVDQVFGRSKGLKMFAGFSGSHPEWGFPVATGANNTPTIAANGPGVAPSHVSSPVETVYGTPGMLIAEVLS